MLRITTYSDNKVNAIIDNLLFCVELEGDGRFSEFTTEEKEEMTKFLLILKEMKIKRYYEKKSTDEGFCFYTDDY